MENRSTVGRRELWEEQRRNRRRTIYLVSGFVALLVGLGLTVDVLFVGNLGDHFVPIAAPLALAYGVAQSLGGYFMGAKAVLTSTRARPADRSEPREAILLNVVEEMRLASGLPRPGVHVVPDPDPNAFAVGRDPEHAAIAVTEGLLDALDRDELQGVVAHEMAHIRNFDIRTMTVVAALLGALVLISDLSTRVLWRGGGMRGVGRGRRSDSGAGALLPLVFVAWIVLIVVTPLIARMMAFAVSRSREYDADATAVEFTRNPLGLANALRKIDAAPEPTIRVKRGSAHLCIGDPRGHAASAVTGRVASLFATHPPMEKRIAILEGMAGAAARS